MPAPMKPFDHLLAATDLSAPARRAAERAALLSRETGAALELLHVADLAPLDRLRRLMNASAADMSQRVLGAAQVRLDALAQALRERYGVDAVRRVVAGSLITELSGRASELASGLLVCGARGESVLRHHLLGSTASRLLGGTDCPLLVVRQVAHEPYRRVLVPVDLSAASPRVIAQALRLAPAAEFVLLHVFEVPFEAKLRYASVDAATLDHYRLVTRDEALQAMQRLCDEAALPAGRTHQLVVHGDPAAQVMQIEQEQECDLIVIGKHGEGALPEFLIGSVTEQVLAESQADVLVCP